MLCGRKKCIVMLFSFANVQCAHPNKGNHLSHPQNGHEVKHIPTLIPFFDSFLEAHYQIIPHVPAAPGYSYFHLPVTPHTLNHYC